MGGHHAHVNVEIPKLAPFNYMNHCTTVQWLRN